MPRTTQLTLRLQSRPGVLAALTKALADARVNITALSAGEGRGRGTIRLIVNDPARARRALRKGGYRVSEEPAFVVRLRNKPGALARVTGRLGRARINIKTAYATTAGRAATVVLVAGNAARARKVLG